MYYLLKADVEASTKRSTGDPKQFRQVLEALTTVATEMGAQYESHGGDARWFSVFQDPNACYATIEAFWRAHDEGKVPSGSLRWLIWSSREKPNLQTNYSLSVANAETLEKIYSDRPSESILCDGVTYDVLAEENRMQFRSVGLRQVSLPTRVAFPLPWVVPRLFWAPRRRFTGTGLLNSALVFDARAYDQHGFFASQIEMPILPELNVLTSKHPAIEDDFSRFAKGRADYDGKLPRVVGDLTWDNEAQRLVVPTALVSWAFKALFQEPRTYLPSKRAIVAAVDAWDKLAHVRSPTDPELRLTETWINRWNQIPLGHEILVVAKEERTGEYATILRRRSEMEGTHVGKWHSSFAGHVKSRQIVKVGPRETVDVSGWIRNEYELELSLLTAPPEHNLRLFGLQDHPAGATQDLIGTWHAEVTLQELLAPGMRQAGMDDLPGELELMPASVLKHVPEFWAKNEVTTWVRLRPESVRRAFDKWGVGSKEGAGNIIDEAALLLMCASGMA